LATPWSSQGPPACVSIVPGSHHPDGDPIPLTQNHPVTIDSTTPASNIYGYTVLIGIGIGCTVLAGFSVVQVMLPPSDANAAVGFMAFGQALGGIAVLGAAGSVFQNLAAEYIAALLPGASTAEIQTLMAGTNSEFFHGLDPDLREQVVTAITRSISRTFAVSIAATAVAFVLSVFMSVSLFNPLPSFFGLILVLTHSVL
jgi:hypothetical protein